MGCEKPTPLAGAYTAKVWLPDVKLAGTFPLMVTTPWAFA